MQGSIDSDSPREKSFAVHAYSSAITTAVATAYAEAVASVKSVQDAHECYAYGNAEGCILTLDHPEGICAECTAETITKANVTEIDAIAEAGAPLSIVDMLH